MHNTDWLGEPTTEANMIPTKVGIFVHDFQSAQSHHVGPPTELIRVVRWIPSPHIIKLTPTWLFSMRWGQLA